MSCGHVFIMPVKHKKMFAKQVYIGNIGNVAAELKLEDTLKLLKHIETVANLNATQGLESGTRLHQVHYYSRRTFYGACLPSHSLKVFLLNCCQDFSTISATQSGSGKTAH